MWVVVKDKKDLSIRQVDDETGYTGDGLLLVTRCDNLYEAFEKRDALLQNASFCKDLVR